MKQNGRQSSSWHNHSDASRSGALGILPSKAVNPPSELFVVEVWTTGGLLVPTTTVQVIA